jgi:hypothetical protein
MYTEIIAILDASSSMYDLEESTINHFQEFIDGQKEIEGEVKVTVTQFHTHADVLFNGVGLNEVDIRGKYRASGMTALYDAIGETFYEAGKRFTKMDKKPDKVIVMIITDGLDNASAKYSRDTVKKIIEHQREKYSWEVLFIGANIDSDEVSRGLGIDYSARYTANDTGTKSVYTSVSNAVNECRTKGFVPMDWAGDIE